MIHLVQVSWGMLFRRFNCHFVRSSISTYIWLMISTSLLRNMWLLFTQCAHTFVALQAWSNYGIFFQIRHIKVHDLIGIITSYNLCIRSIMMKAFLSCFRVNWNLFYSLFILGYKVNSWFTMTITRLLTFSWCMTFSNLLLILYFCQCLYLLLKMYLLFLLLN